MGDYGGRQRREKLCDYNLKIKTKKQRLFKEKNKHCQTGGDGSLGKGLDKRAYKPEFKSLTPMLKPEHRCDPRAGLSRDRKIPGTCWQTNVADIVTPRFNENLCLEKKGEKNKNRIGERRHPDVNVWPSGALQQMSVPPNTYVCISTKSTHSQHTHTYTYTFLKLSVFLPISSLRIS